MSPAATKPATTPASISATNTITGLKTAANWLTIPGNKTWHTARFRLVAQQFNNYWSYNFALQSDSNTFYRYYQKSVEARKVKAKGGWERTVIQLPSDGEFNFELIQL